MMTNNLGTADSPKQGWSLLAQFLKDKPVIDVLWTISYFILQPLRFTDEVMIEDWSNKAKPPRFLIETYLLAVGLVLVTPWRVLDQVDTSLTTAQQAFIKGAELVFFCIGFFVASALAHVILSDPRVQYIRAFFLFCYLQGATLVLSHFIVAFLWLLFPNPSGPILLLTAVGEFAFFIITVFYLLIPMKRVYSSPWYRVVAAGVIALAVFVCVGVIGGYIAETVAARFPSA